MTSHGKGDQGEPVQQARCVQQATSIQQALAMKEQSLNSSLPGLKGKEAAMDIDYQGERMCT